MKEYYVVFLDAEKEFFLMNNRTNKIARFKTAETAMKQIRGYEFELKELIGLVVK